ncbi:MAG TPA: hypothetical protein VKZ97_03280 [Flavobacteriaceae bacterium]|nr:hypothetical protein [Flavobacteriaceae bacterium]
MTRDLTPYAAPNAARTIKPPSMGSPGGGGGAGGGGADPPVS